MSLKDNDGVIVLGSDTLNPLNNITLKSTTSGSLEVFQGVPGNLGNLVTTLNVNGSATEALAGIVKIASTAQAQGLTDNSTVLSPARLDSAFKNGNQSLSYSGYQKLPGGLIIQWGTTGSFAAETNISITFPIAFPNNVFVMTANDFANLAAKAVVWSIDAPTLSTGTVHWSPGANGVGSSPTRPCLWVAIGH